VSCVLLGLTSDAMLMLVRWRKLTMAN